MPSDDHARDDDVLETAPDAFLKTTQSRPVTSHSETSQSLTPQSPSFFEHTGQDDGGFELTPLVQVFDESNLPIEFGNYVLLELVGEGGAGIVFKAKRKSGHGDNDSVDGQQCDFVAVKLLRPEIMASQRAAQRFMKESRLHAEVDSPYVTRHLEFGCEQGAHFIASEFVDGLGLNEVMDQLRAFPVKQSFRVIADVLRALAALHRNDVIHRDVKPANIIVSLRSGKKPAADFTFDDFEIAKLTDFGLARHVEQSESLAMTRQQTMLGTPIYMAPEQYFESRAVDARADIYSVGVTLYQMLTGHPPFRSEEAVELSEMHRVERPRPVMLARQGTSEAVNNIVMKALEKEPSLRYQDASEMLADVERVLNDQPTSLRLYPETPDAFHPSVRSYDFEWDLNAPAKQLWPLVSDTDRFNQAIGLPAPKFTYDHSGPQRKIFANANFNGMKVRWREHPFQWILNREMSVLREFETGPFEWVTSTVELHPLAGNRTRLIHSFQVKPRGLFGKLMTPIQFNIMTKRSLNRVYANLENIANDQSCGYACDVSFSKPMRLSSVQRDKLAQRSDRLAELISNRVLASEFSQLLILVADPFAARIRPIPLSQKLDCSVDASIEVCLRGVEVGLLNMSWDVICPVCRISSGNASSLSRIEGHGHCEVCNLDFEVDFSKSVEVVFSVHPEIRPIELKTYCIGGPYHAPHVLAQNRLSANQFVDVGTELAVGKYDICGPQLGSQPSINVHVDAIASRAEVTIGGDSLSKLPELQAGSACVHIDNQSEIEVLVRLEQSTNRGDSVSAATASRHPLFQKLFPNEVFEPDALVDLSNVYLLAIKHLNADKMIDKVGDIQVRQFWTQLQKRFPTEGTDCQIVECTHELLLVSFDLVESLLASLDEILSTRTPTGIPIGECCFAINSGEIMLGSQANQPVAFGKTVRKTKQILSGVSDCSLLMPGELYNSIRSGDSSAAFSQLLCEFNKSLVEIPDGFIQLLKD